MGPQLLHGPGSERVTGGDEDAQLVLDQPETNLDKDNTVNIIMPRERGDKTYLGQIGALAHSVHSAECYNIPRQRAMFYLVLLREATHDVLR